MKLRELALARTGIGDHIRAGLELRHARVSGGRRAEGRDVAGRARADWQGEHGDQLKASFTIRDGQPVVHELAARKSGGSWITLGRDAVPEFDVVSGKRRLSEQQMGPLRELKVSFTPEVVEREKWNAFWDSPLMVPGRKGTNMDLPRHAEEIHRAKASFHATGCKVKTEGARIEVSFPGVDMGIFSGQLQYTVYRGTNLLRQEVIAKTDEPSVAYKYNGGLKGFTIGNNTRVVWRDMARAWQQYEFGGTVNQDKVGLRARNRLGILEAGGGLAGVSAAVAQIFLRARDRDQSRLRLLPQGQRHVLRDRRAAAGARRRAEAMGRFRRGVEPPGRRIARG